MSHPNHPNHSEPMLIAPECHAAGCHNDGDQYMMVKCRSCGHWFCPEHLESEDGARSVTLVDSGLRGLSYYQGHCAACRGRMLERKPVNSSWLR
jgi:hypothetical protein